MVKHNNQVPNQHFKKKWQLHVRTWFNQPARKERRRNGARPPRSGRATPGCGRAALACSALLEGSAAARCQGAAAEYGRPCMISAIRLTRRYTCVEVCLPTWLCAGMGAAGWQPMRAPRHRCMPQALCRGGVAAA